MFTGKKQPTASHRWLVPLALIALGAALLIGCIPIPAPEKILAGTDYRKFAGDDGQLLRNGVTTRQEIVARLGQPQKSAEGGRFAAYYLHTNSGFWIMPLCFHATPDDHFRLLMLEYDAKGTLIQHRLERVDNGPYIFVVEEYDLSSIKRDFAGSFGRFMEHPDIFDRAHNRRTTHGG
jgi:hypothetical protein